MNGSPRLLIAFTFATVVVVGAVIALVTGSWWVLAAAILVHLAATGAVMLLIGRRLDEGYKPDPVSEAQLEERRHGPLSAR